MSTYRDNPKILCHFAKIKAGEYLADLFVRRARAIQIRVAAPSEIKTSAVVFGRLGVESTGPTDSVNPSDVVFTFLFIVCGGLVVFASKGGNGEREREREIVRQSLAPSSGPGRSKSPQPRFAWIGSDCDQFRL